jgi:hypothetical protein
MLETLSKSSPHRFFEIAKSFTVIEQEESTKPSSQSHRGYNQGLRDHNLITSHLDRIWKRRHIVHDLNKSWDKFVGWVGRSLNACHTQETSHMNTVRLIGNL